MRIFILKSNSAPDSFFAGKQAAVDYAERNKFREDFMIVEYHLESREEPFRWVKTFFYGMERQ